MDPDPRPQRERRARTSGSPSPLVSVVVPVRNGEPTIERCIRSIRRSYYRHYEILVVNDHSNDRTVEILERLDCAVLHLEGETGANAARNLGASVANGSILVFLDADIVFRRETLLTIVESLEDDEIDAVVGLYTAKHVHQSFVSQYKNLWIRYSYLKSPPVIDWLFGSVSGIRREAFSKIGGFDIRLLARDGHDDIELGKRCAEANLRIVLNVDIEVEHLKHYTLWGFVRNEYRRSCGFAELSMRLGETLGSVRTGFANVYPVFIFSTIYVAALLPLGVLWAVGMVGTDVMAAAVGLYLAVNVRFLNFLEQVRGVFAMIAMIPIMVLDHLVCFAGSLAGIVRGVMAPKAGSQAARERMKT